MNPNDGEADNELEQLIPWLIALALFMIGAVVAFNWF